MTAFEEFGVIPELAKAVELMEWLLPTDVQAEAIPMILGGDDSSFHNFTLVLQRFCDRRRCFDGC